MKPFNDPRDLPPGHGFLAGGGEATRLILARDWSMHPLGPPPGWPDALKVALSTILNSPESMILSWGREELFFFFNETYFPLLGPRLDWAMGAPFVEVWTDGWAQAKPIIDDAFAGRSQRFVDLPWKLATDRGVADTWWTFSYSRILGADGEIVGLFIFTKETTNRVLSDLRRQEIEIQSERAQEAGGVGLFAVDRDGLVHATPSFFRLYGLEPAERAPAALFEALVLPADAGEASTQQGRLDGSIALDVEYRIRRADDGTVRWIARKGEIVRDDAGGFVSFSGVSRDITDQVAAREAQARRQRYQEALLALGDRLRDLRDPAEIAHVAAEALGKALDVDWVGFGDIDADAGVIRVQRDWTSGGASFAGDHRLRDDGGYAALLKRGETVAVCDALDDPRVAPGDGLAAAGVRAFVKRPIFEQGVFRAMLYVASRTPRDWRDDELAMIRDVSDRLHAFIEWARSEEERRESEEQFRVFAQAVPNHVWAAETDGQITWVNDREIAYLGPRARLASGPFNFSAFIHPDERDEAIQAWRRSLETGGRFVVEARLLRHDDSWNWFLIRAEAVRNARGEIVRWVGTNTDIDDTKRQAEELAAINSSLEGEIARRTADRNRLWQMASNIMLVASPEGVIEAANPAWAQVLGWAEGELVGRSLFDFLHVDDRERSMIAAEAIGRGQAFARFENRLRHKNGSYKDILWTAGPAEGKMIGVGQDWTDEKAQALVLAATEDQLRQSQKMEAVGQLTGGIAHDFNNMLTGVIGSMDLLRRHLADGRMDRVDRYIDAATTSAQRAAGLTQRLLAFSRRQSLDVKPTDVDALVGGMEDLFRRTLGEDVALEVRLDAAPWLARTDANQLESALLNLAINARDAMPGGGQLHIETRTRALGGSSATAIAGVAAGDFVEVSVCDTGTGMAPEVIAKAFDPFFTTKPIGSGTGLGLSMIYGFAKQSGGHVEIESAVGVGTTVRLFLPRAAEGADQPAAPAISVPARPGEQVLLVEDDPAVRMLVSDVLADLGYAVEQAGDAREAIPLLAAMDRLDLLISDVGLPGMNGRQLADIARETRPDLKVLFVTGYAERAAIRSDFLAPGMDMMTKPFAIELLSAKIREMIG